MTFAISPRIGKSTFVTSNDSSSSRGPLSVGCIFILSARRRVRVEELGLYPAIGRTPFTRAGFAGRNLLEQ